MATSCKKSRLNDQETPVREEQPIKEIDKDTIKFIAAGEKISDIETAIRELIENSIDAEAKCIEIRLAGFGAEAIEIEDNGFGIDESNFKSIGIRYHTSKIRDYKNLQDNLETFGFRGEALSCLCNIANVTITTKAKKSPTGWKLTFHRDGQLAKREPVGRDVGTTVVVKKLFHSMPVRRRELELNAKKQYDKIIRLIYEEVLARPHIKFSLVKKNAAKKEKDFTHGGSTLEGCIITIFGINVLESLMPIRQTGLIMVKDDLEDNKEKAITTCEKTNKTTTTNGISPEDKTQLESSTEMRDYSQSNADGPSQSTQPPNEDIKFQAPVVTNIARRCSGGEFFKRSCKSKFAREKPEYKIYGYISKLNSGRNSTDCQFLFVNKKPCDIPRVTRLINEIYRNYSKDQHPFYCLFIEVQSWAADFNVPRKRAVILQEESKLCEIVRDSLEEMFSPCVPASQKSCPIAQIPMLTIPKQQDTSLQPKEPHQSPPDSSKNEENRTASTGFRNGLDIYIEQVSGSNTATDESKFFKDNNLTSHPIGASTKRNHDSIDAQATSDCSSNCNGKRRPTTPILPYPGPDQSGPICSSSTTPPLQAIVSSSPQQPATKRISPAKLAPKPVLQPCKFHQDEMLQNGDLNVRIDYLEDLPVALERERAQRRLNDDLKEFSFAIHPKFNSVAEDQLKFNLNKTSFQDMQVMGQFNKGFIIAKLNKHLFIIDQHATDERANYEDQLERSPLEKQTMVHPKPLFLNLIQENAILNNMEAFTKRGFEFAINKQAMIGYRVMLTATSICKGIGRDEYLGKEDVEELIDVIVESPNRLESYTLKKVREVAASRACRKSVMIGDSLTWTKMAGIVSRMSNLQNPWVCAHNRPTIRHLMDVDWMDG